MVKRRRWQRKKLEQDASSSTQSQNHHHHNNNNNNNNIDIVEQVGQTQRETDHLLNNEATETTIETTKKKSATIKTIAQVLTFSILGTLDECSYFPSLMLSNTFNVVQLSIGSLFACILIIVAVTILHTMCSPILDFFDRVPLYVVVAIFATIMSVSVVVDVFHDV